MIKVREVLIVREVIIVKGVMAGACGNVSNNKNEKLGFEHSNNENLLFAIL